MVEGDDGHIRGQYPFLQTSSPNLPMKILFPVTGSNLEGTGTKSCLQAFYFVVLPLRVFIPLKLMCIDVIKGAPGGIMDFWALLGLTRWGCFT